MAGSPKTFVKLRAANATPKPGFLYAVHDENSPGLATGEVVVKLGRTVQDPVQYVTANYGRTMRKPTFLCLARVSDVVFAESTVFRVLAPRRVNAGHEVFTLTPESVRQGFEVLKAVFDEIQRVNPTFSFEFVETPPTKVVSSTKGRDEAELKRREEAALKRREELGRARAIAREELRLARVRQKERELSEKALQVSDAERQRVARFVDTCLRYTGDDSFLKRSDLYRSFLKYDGGDKRTYIGKRKFTDYLVDFVGKESYKEKQHGPEHAKGVLLGWTWKEEKRVTEA